MNFFRLLERKFYSHVADIIGNTGIILFKGMPHLKFSEIFRKMESKNLFIFFTSQDIKQNVLLRSSLDN